MFVFFGCHSSPMDGFESCVLWYVGYDGPISFHLEDFACPSEPNSMSRLWGELYVVS